MIDRIKRILKREEIKFIIVGIINTIVGTAIMIISKLILDAFGVEKNITYWTSVGLNFTLGSILSYYLNKNYTFQNKEKSLKQVILFSINIIICMLISFTLSRMIGDTVFHFVEEKNRDTISQLIGTVIFTFINYFGQKLVVFKKK